ncbi:phage tail protein [Clostridium rectalis]|uniref:hyaluronate lyase N-terminal domain-containing protein n=1 Tax=Clostridium rectalis TaxID=2040295 RepID=UPI000F638369|nr:phage tail protein [Clostridium rectalis]
MSRKVLIQIRRGLEKDIVTLAVGELGYCEDSKKLYIGSKGGNILLAANKSFGDMLKTVYDTNNNGKIDMAELADKVPWDGIIGKPNSFPPSVHNHDISYIKKAPLTWNNLKGV